MQTNVTITGLQWRCCYLRNDIACWHLVIFITLPFISITRNQVSSGRQQYLTQNTLRFRFGLGYTIRWVGISSTGGCRNTRARQQSVAVPPGVVTETSPELPAPTTAVIIVDDTTIYELAAVPPKLTMVALVKFE